MINYVFCRLNNLTLINLLFIIDNLTLINLLFIIDNCLPKIDISVILYYKNNRNI